MLDEIEDVIVNTVVIHLSLSTYILAGETKYNKNKQTM